MWCTGKKLLIFAVFSVSVFRSHLDDCDDGSENEWNCPHCGLDMNLDSIQKLQHMETCKPSQNEQGNYWKMELVNINTSFMYKISEKYLTYSNHKILKDVNILIVLYDKGLFWDLLRLQRGKILKNQGSCISTWIPVQLFRLKRDCKIIYSIKRCPFRNIALSYSKNKLQNQQCGSHTSSKITHKHLHAWQCICAWACSVQSVLFNKENNSSDHAERSFTCVFCKA